MSNVYDDMSVFAAVNKVRDGYLILPEFQRDFCWKLDAIEDLFFSIIKDFPIGSFIMWQTKGENINKSSADFYSFLDEARYKRKTGDMISRNKVLKKNLKNNDDYYVVLDGQQRLTSFYLVFNGRLLVKKAHKKGDDNNDANFDEKELYYNLDRYNDDPDGETNPFMFLSSDETEDGNYYKISDIQQYAGNENKFQDDISKIQNDKVRSDFRVLFSKLNSGDRDRSLIHYYKISSSEYDDALDVFVKVNSTGEPLSKSDLLFGKLINGWDSTKKREGKRKEIEDFIAKLNDDYDFEFNKDFLLRSSYVLTSGKANLSMQKICEKKTVTNIRNNWEKVKRSLIECCKKLHEIEINDARVLSYNAIIPIMYYIYQGGNFKTATSRNELKKYFAISFAKGLFGGSSNQAIENSCAAIKAKKGNDFNVDFFENTDFSGGRNFLVSLDDIDKWLNTYEKGKKTYPLLMLVSPDLNLISDSFDQDHSHADALFNSDYFAENHIDESKLSEWRSKRNLLPNLSFMRTINNQQKNKTDLKTWMNEHPDQIKYLRCLPLNTDYSLSNFEEFFKLRRSMMKYSLANSFGVELPTIKTNDRVTLNALNGIVGLNIGMHGVVKSINGDSASVEFVGDNKTLDVLLDNLNIVESF